MLGQLLDVDGEPLIHHMLVDARAVDHPGDRDELLTGGVGPGLTPVINRVPCSASAGCRAA